MDIGNKIKKFRKSKGFTQIELASKANISRSYLADIENNRYNPSIEVLKSVANALNVSVEEFFKDDNLKNTEDINIPQDYLDQHKITTRDKKQYLEYMKKANEAFFMNDEFDEEDKKEILDTMNEIFWRAKAMNKRKPKQGK